MPPPHLTLSITSDLATALWGKGCLLNAFSREGSYVSEMIQGIQLENTRYETATWIFGPQAQGLSHYTGCPHPPHPTPQHSSSLKPNLNARWPNNRATCHYGGWGAGKREWGGWRADTAQEYLLIIILNSTMNIVLMITNYYNYYQ